MSLFLTDLSWAERMPPHGFAAHDELIHAPGPSSGERWQENMFYIGWDERQACGFVIHTRRWPGRNDHEAHIALAIGGQVCSLRVHRPLDTANDSLPEFSVTVEEPWRRIHLQAEFNGAVGQGPLGFVAHAKAGDTRARCDIRYESDLPAADFDAAFARLSNHGDTRSTRDQRHYEQGGRWSGTIQIGDVTIEAGGLCVRDHSWGTRSECDLVGGAFWTASCLDEGKLFCNAIGFMKPDGTASGVGIIVDPHGAYVTYDVGARFEPAAGLGFTGARVHFGPAQDLVLDAQVQQHFPFLMDGSGRNRFDDNGVSLVRMGGFTGIGCIEFAGVLDDSGASTLQL